jgi:hypothetical protein
MTDGLYDYPKEMVVCKECGTNATNPNFERNQEVQASESGSDFDPSVWINPVLF